MPGQDPIAGTSTQGDDPDWQPLLDLIGEDLVEWFMWMFEVELADGASVHAYKHVATRRYLHLARDGRAFGYTHAGRYLEIPRRTAIRLAFDGWENLQPQPDDPAAARIALLHACAAAG